MGYPAGYRVAVAGATGLVGRTIVRVLEERNFPVRELVALASERSAGSLISFRSEQVEVKLLTEQSFVGCDLALFSAGASVSRRFAPGAADHTGLAIDNSSAFRMDPAIPLVVPEVNAHTLDGPYRGIVANPNCSTIQLVAALHPLHNLFGLQRVVVSTYQSVSGSGAKGVQALDYELETGRRHPESPYPYPVAFNALPHVADFDESGWSTEERKMMNETRKIMELPSLHVVPTTVRVPVRVSHSESVYACFERPVSLAAARRALGSSPGIVLEDEPTADLYPLAIRAEGRDEVFVGRIRSDPQDPRAMAFWVVADNLRKGAATNAVQIAEVVLDLTRTGKQVHRA
jgi:aspartate-semialdehyde dehydrogenase